MDIIQKLLYGDQPEAQRVDLSLTAPANPWTVKPGEGGVLPFQSDEDDEDRELRESLTPVTKLFAPKSFSDASCASTGTEHATATTTSTGAEHFRFSKQADAPVVAKVPERETPLEKRAPKPEPKELRYEKVIENGEMVSKGYDPVSGELKSYIVLLSEHEIE